MDWIHVNHFRLLVVRPVVPVVLLTYFDVPLKIEDLTKSKNFCRKLLQKIKSCIILVKKTFLVLGALLSPSYLRHSYM